MLATTVVLGVVYLFQMEQVTSFVAQSVVRWIQDETRILYWSIFASLISTVAIWLWNRDRKKNDDNRRQKRLGKIASIRLTGFIEDHDDRPETGWEQYVKTLSDRLSKTRLKNESFALGIAGDWGSGKTTFIGLLKKEMARTFDVVDFNPWLCTSSEMVISDFFNTLSHHLPKSETQLTTDIKKYARLLVNTEVLPGRVTALMDYIVKDRDHSLTAIKTRIEEQLKKSEIRYAVVIDDLDRLESTELFEVLRLIRITASFSNLLFIVTYDRHHIKEMLMTNGISNGSQYIKKIFNTEVVLPEPELYILPNLLMDELSRLLGKTSMIPNAIIDSVFAMGPLNTYLILDYLENFRDVKRFAMAFAADVSNIDKNHPQEFSYPEFFLLEILRYTDYDTYNNLRNNPSKFLNEQNSVLIAKDNLIEILPGKQKSVNLIKQMFPKEQQPASPISIRFKNKINDYFSFRIQKDKVSLEEFNKLFGLSESQIESELISFYKQNKIRSLYEIVKQTSPNSITDTQNLKRYLYVMFMLMHYTNRYYISTIKEKLQLSHYKNRPDKEEIKVYIEEKIRGINEGNTIKRSVINILLTSLHSSCSYAQEEEECHYDNRTILDDRFLVEESEKNLHRLLESDLQGVSICESTKDRSSFRTFMAQATAASSYDYSYNPGIQYYVCLPFKEFLAYFTEHKSDKLSEFMEPFKFDNDEEEFYYDEQYFDDRMNIIEKIFGSRENFKKIIINCFNNPEKDKKRWLDYWKLKA